MNQTAHARTADDGLDAFFAAARSHPPEPHASLLLRVAADAEAVMPARLAACPPAPRAFGAVLSRWAERLAWPAGLSAAALAGLWLGVEVSQPVMLQAEALLSSDVGYSLAGMFPGLAPFGGGM